jgi:hypothetical protein
MVTTTFLFPCVTSPFLAGTGSGEGTYVVTEAQDAYAPER